MFAIKYLKYIRDYLYFKNRYTSILIDYININIRKKKENKLLRQIEDNGGNIINSQELVNIIKKENDKICHIVGLGGSLNNSKELIDTKNAYIIGMNEAAISGLKFDLYLMEPGDGSDNRTKRQTAIIDDLINRDDTLILMKNVYICENKGIGYLKENYLKKLSFIQNLGIVCGNDRNITHWCKRVLRFNSKYILQYKSTVVTAIAIAKNAGFKTIILHGVDFGGKYFYEDSIYSEYEKYIPPINSRYSHFLNNKENLIHPTSNKKSGMEKILLILNKILEHDGITLYSATESSPLSDIIKVYNEK